MWKAEPIRKAVLSAVGPNAKGNDPTSPQLVMFLTPNDTRDEVYEICVKYMEEQGRAPGIARLLQAYIPSFPPSRAILEAIREKCAVRMQGNHPQSAVFKELDNLIVSGLGKPMEQKKDKNTKKSKAKPYVQNNRNYVAAFHLQPTDVTRDRAFIDFQTDADSWGKASSPLAPPGHLSPHSVVCKDYINQWPLSCNDNIIMQQLSALSHFWDRYRSNPTVVNASRFLIKQVCDGYVAKLPFGAPYQFFRSVSICYLSMLFEWMQSDYLCVQVHVYDFLLTLSAHVQLVDPSGHYPGCSEALQQEVIWLLLCVLERQSLSKPADDTVWWAATKCALAVVPLDYLWLIDARALLHFMKLPGMAELHPRAFTLLAEAFECCLLHDSKQDEAAAHGTDVDGPQPLRPAIGDALEFNQTELRKLGTNALAEVLALYRRSSTVGARLVFFKLVFVWAVARFLSRSGDRHGDITRSKVLQCYDVLVSVDFFWHIHPLLFYMSQAVKRGLPGNIVRDFLFLDSKDIDALAPQLVQAVLDLISEDLALPPEVNAIFNPGKSDAAAAGDAHSAVPGGGGIGAAASASRGGVKSRDQAGGAAGPAARKRDVPLRDAVYDAITAVPKILSEKCDLRTYNIGWKLAFYGFRSCALFKYDGELMSEYLANQILGSNSPPAKRAAPPFSQRLCPDLLTSLYILSRTRRDQAVAAFDEVIERFLLSPQSRPPMHRVVFLCQRLLECIAVADRDIATRPVEADITMLLLDGTMRIPPSSATALGRRVLWGFYRILYNEHTETACRTRFVLVNILGGIMPSRSNNPAAQCAWGSITLDPCSRVAGLAETAKESLLPVEGRKAF